MNTEYLSQLKIHKLSKAQYDRELEAGRIDATALYFTPEDADTSTKFRKTLSSSNWVSASSVSVESFDQNLDISSAFTYVYNESIVTGIPSAVVDSGVIVFDLYNGAITTSSAIATALPTLAQRTAALDAELHGFFILGSDGTYEFRIGMTGSTTPTVDIPIEGVVICP